MCTTACLHSYIHRKSEWGG
uniref:Uncharacterized protein n=1 Tax=Rhizophora mucronata TaxID=61149 RepID=A0A2P2PUJ4_RHIMU